MSKKILFIWEQGADYGHIYAFLPIALEMKRRGHEPILVLKDLTWAEKALGGHGLTWLQGPVWQANLGGLPSPISYSEVMFRNGFSHDFGLLALCRAWQNLIALIKPDLLVFDFCSTSMLATLYSGIPRVRIGASYVLPPLSRPIESNSWWLQQPTTRLAEIENAALGTANKVLSKLGQDPISALSQVLKCDEEFIFGSHSLDQYPQRKGGNYFGAIQDIEQGTLPNWPTQPGKRVFAYLKTSYRHFDAVLKALAALDINTVVHAPGISQKNINTYQSNNLTFSVDPIQMESARRQCDLGICHAGAGTTEALLAAGKPVLLLPMQGEQESTARRVEQLGAGLWVHPEAITINFKKLLKRLLNETGFTQKAIDFANNNPERPQAERVSELVDRCEKLLFSK